MTTEAENEFRSESGLLALWAGLLVAPVAWAMQMQVAYLLVPWTCMHGHHYLHYVVTVVALLLAAGGGLIAWACWRKVGGEWPDSSGGSLARTRFMAALGVLTSAMFFLVILAQGLPALVFHSCEL